MTIQKYAEVYEVEGEQREDLFYYLEQLDQAYLTWSNAKREKQLASKTPPKPKKARKR